MAEYKASWTELNEAWPWRQVMEFYEGILERRFVVAFPQYDSMALTVNMHRRKGTAPIKTLALMPDFLLPVHLRDDSRGKAIYSDAVVESFESFHRDKLVSNGLLASLNTADLRASGWAG